LIRLADLPFKELDHRLREVQVFAFIVNVLLAEAVFHHEQGHVADPF